MRESGCALARAARPDSRRCCAVTPRSNRCTWPPGAGWRPRPPTVCWSSTTSHLWPAAIEPRTSCVATNSTTPGNWCTWTSTSSVGFLTGRSQSPRTRRRAGRPGPASRWWASVPAPLSTSTASRPPPEIRTDEEAATCGGFLHQPSAWCAQHGVVIERVLTDKRPGPALAEDRIRAGHAVRWYSWRMPPSRSCRRMLRGSICSGSVTGVGKERSGRAFAMPW